ncbi:hypothetical protein H4582DRAFT_2057379 [Lactarius indigo]|nr:hypothetical protein H4582DRAFT_2057379 [Lactarius indigo]
MIRLLFACTDAQPVVLGSLSPKLRTATWYSRWLSLQYQSLLVNKSENFVRFPAIDSQHIFVTQCHRRYRQVSHEGKDRYFRDPNRSHQQKRQPGVVLDIPGARFRTPTVMLWVNIRSKSHISEQQGTTTRPEAAWSIKSLEYLVLVDHLLTQQTGLIEGDLGQRQDGVARCVFILLRFERQPDPA